MTGSSEGSGTADRPCTAGGFGYGIYEVTVKLAEIRKLEPGERVFDIYAGEKPLAVGMDVSAAVGKETATGRRSGPGLAVDPDRSWRICVQ
ncbi:malectin domain-containing carbohydrate-binding protein [Streptomyces sp. NPDC055749]